MKSILLILMCFVSFSLFAQKKWDKKSMKEKMEKYTPMMTRGIGATFQEFEGLNNRIAAFPQYKTLRNHMWTLTAGSMQVHRNFVSQFSVTGGSSLTGDPDERSSTTRFLSGGFDIGYDVIPSDMVMVYPMVGIGAETYRAIFYKDVSATNFNDVLISPTVQNNIRSLKFGNTFVTYRLGLGIAFKSPKDPGTIGIQAGYTGSFKEKSWKSAESQTLANAPTDDVHRFSISLVFTGKSMMMMK